MQHFVGWFELSVQSDIPPLLDDPEHDTVSLHLFLLSLLSRNKAARAQGCTKHPSVVCSTVRISRTMTQQQLVSIHSSSILTYFPSLFLLD